MFYRVVFIVSVLLFCACKPQGTAWEWQLPPGFPAPPVPADNPMTVEKVALGEKLFFDTRLSANNSQACASCHQREFAFAEARTVSIGSTGEMLQRNALSLTNVAYNASFTWAHPALTELERQILIPLFNEEPVEMGLSGNEAQVLARLQADADYPQLFQQAFPREKNPLTLDNTVKALASFVRSLLSFNSRFDRYAYYGEEVLNEQELQGLDLFMSERTECKHCHSGFNFSTSTVHENTDVILELFHNTGLYAEQDVPEFDRGIFELSGEDKDRGLFRPPTLRNIAYTAPYMHDGSIATLEEVIDFYAAGGREVQEGPWPGDGRTHKNKSLFLHGFSLSEEEKAALLAFLHTLSDPAFIGPTEQNCRSAEKCGGD